MIVAARLQVCDELFGLVTFQRFHRYYRWTVNIEVYTF
jgi:hypothetical protein